MSSLGAGILLCVRWEELMDSSVTPFLGWPVSASTDAVGYWCRSLAESPCPTEPTWWRRSSHWRDTLPRTKLACPPTAGGCQREDRQDASSLSPSSSERVSNYPNYCHPNPPVICVIIIMEIMSAVLITARWEGWWLISLYLEPGDHSGAVPLSKGSPFLLASSSSSCLIEDKERSELRGNTTPETSHQHRVK